MDGCKLASPADMTPPFEVPLAKGPLSAVIFLTIGALDLPARLGNEAQTPGSAGLLPETSSPPPTPVSQPSTTPGDTSSHRLFGVLANFMTVENDSGDSRFNYSEVFGSAAAAGISAYSCHPRDDRSLKTVGTVWGIQMGYDALSFPAKEFRPDIRNKWHKSKSD